MPNAIAFRVGTGICKAALTIGLEREFNLLRLSCVLRALLVLAMRVHDIRFVTARQHSLLC